MTMRQDVEILTDRLETTVRRLTWAMMDCDPEDLNAAPEPGEWSPLQILAHLKASDDIVMPRIPMILTRDHPLLPDVDERMWADIAGYVDAPVDQTLLVFQRRRNETLWQLRRLPDEAWDLVGVHEERGEMTLYAMLASFAAHEEEHLAQLHDLLGIEAEEN